MKLCIQIGPDTVLVFMASVAEQLGACIEKGGAYTVTNGPDGAALSQPRALHVDTLTEAELKAMLARGEALPKENGAAGKPEPKSNRKTRRAKKAAAKGPRKLESKP